MKSTRWCVYRFASVIIFVADVLLLNVFFSHLWLCDPVILKTFAKSYRCCIFFGWSRSCCHVVTCRISVIVIPTNTAKWDDVWGDWGCLVIWHRDIEASSVVYWISLKKENCFPTKILGLRPIDYWCNALYNIACILVDCFPSILFLYCMTSRLVFSQLMCLWFYVWEFINSHW